MDTGGKRMTIVIPKISGKQFMENSIISIPMVIWILVGRKLMENGITLAVEMMGQRKLTGKKSMENTIGWEEMEQ